MPQLRHLPNDARLCAIGMLEAGMRQVEVARRLGVSQNSVGTNQQHVRSTSKWVPEIYVASPGYVPAYVSLEIMISKRQTTARTSLKNWNKSVYSNRAESTSQHWT